MGKWIYPIHLSVIKITVRYHYSRYVFQHHILMVQEIIGSLYAYIHDPKVPKV